MWRIQGLALLALIAAGLPLFALDPVALLVPRSTLQALESEIAQYQADVEARFPVRLIVVPGDWDNPEQVRSSIRGLIHSRKITGAVLVGALPMHQFFIHGAPRPDPLYYEAPDAAFDDRDHDGVDDHYRWSAGMMRIWVANVRGEAGANDPGIETLRRFFRKTHAYYSGQTRLENRGLAITDKDWPEGADHFAADPGRRWFGANIDICRAATVDFTRRMLAQHTYTVCYIQVHSTYERQDMEDGPLRAEEIAGWKTGALITINHGCSTCDWIGNATSDRKINTGMSWVFGQGVGEALIGNVRSGMVYDQDVIYARLLAGDYLGRAYFAAKQKAEDDMHRDYPAGDIISGLTLLGNPFLYPKASYAGTATVYPAGPAIKISSSGWSASGNWYWSNSSGRTQRTAAASIGWGSPEVIVAS